VSEAKLRKDARAIFDAALKAADPVEAVRRHVRVEAGVLVAGRRRYRLDAFERVWILGAGKASAAMAQACEHVLGSRVAGGLIVTKYGHGAHLRRVKIHEAAHPVPDEAGLEGARQLIELASRTSASDLVLFLVSGGASALTPAPVPGITLAEKQETTRLLLACGANIHEINTVRKHISAFKGGQVARAAMPATVITLLLSDVIGDNLESIGSGPTVPDPRTFAEAEQVLRGYGLLDRVPQSVLHRIEAGVLGDVAETPKPGDACFAKCQTLLVGSNRLAVDAAAEKARALGYKPMVLSTTIEGETRDVARMHAAMAREVLATGRPLKGPACLLSGGETTVTLKGEGLGGRNQEFALAAAIDLAGLAGVCALSGGTDGTDGPTDAAGAMATGGTIAQARALGLNAVDYLARNDSYHFFAALKDGSLIKTGPTRTNVMDVRLMLVAP